MDEAALNGKTILVTGAARRIGRALALACANHGADIIIHHGHSEEQAQDLQHKINSLGHQAWILSANFENSSESAQLISRATQIRPLYAIVNNAAVFESLSLSDTTLPDWERHLAVNLTAPFLLCQSFSKQLPKGTQGRIVNILDWRALRPGADHFPYTVSKAAFAALTKSLAAALAPDISVNGLALGAILPPSSGTPAFELINNIPAGQWGRLEDVEEALLFLLAGPNYITGEIIHVDGGRHLV